MVNDEDVNNIRDHIARLAVRNLNNVELPQTATADYESLPRTLLGLWQIQQIASETRHAVPLALQDESVRLLGDSGLCEAIARVFRHHTASRKNVGRLSSIYAFPNRLREQFSPEECFNRGQEFVVNNSEADVERFVSQLKRDVSSSPDTVESGIGRGARTIATYFLKGERGCGKTFFLNYLMTEKMQQLTDANICWIRVNLTKPLKNWTLLQRLQHQTLSVCRKYYIQEHLDSEFKEHLDNSFGITSIDEALREFEAIPDPSLEEEVADPVQAMASASEVPIPVNLDPLFREVINFLKNRGLTFLYIIDGLDAALPTSECEEWLDRWLSELPVLLQVMQYEPALWLISVRTESHQKLMRDVGHVIANKGHSRELTLHAPSLSEVVRRRFYEASKREQASGRGLTEVIAYNLCMLFEHFVTSGLSDLHRIRSFDSPFLVQGAPVLDYALGLFQGNYRKLMSVLELCLARFFFLLPSDRQAVFKNPSDNWDQEFIRDLTVFEGPGDGWTREEAVNPFLAAQQETDTLAHDLRIKVERRSHEVLSVFMHGRHVHHLTPFTFEMTDGGGLRVEKAHYFDYRSSFFPNVFSFSPALTVAWRENTPLPINQIKLLPFLQLYILNCLVRRGGNTPREQLYLDMRRVFGRERLVRHIVDAALVNLVFYGQVRAQTILDGEEALLGTEAGKFTVQSLLRNPVYLLSITETIPVPASLPSFLMADFDRVMQGEVSRAERHYIRVRIAFLFLRYLKDQWESIDADTVHKLDGDFIKDMTDTFDNIGKAFSGLVSRLVPNANEIENNSARYAAYRRNFVDR